MKKILFTILVCILVNQLKSQTITLVKDTLVLNSITDSMNYYYSQKMIPFKDSGVVVISYGDSIINNQSAGFRTIVTAYDKNLNTLWAHTVPFSAGYASLAIIADTDYTIYATYLNGSYHYLLGISPNGNIILNKQIESQISSSTTVINGLALFNGKLLVNGSIFYSQKSFAPFLAYFDKNGNIIKKKIFSASSSLSYKGLYNCSLLNITRENNISITYQLDSTDDYVIACYDSLFNKIWSNIFPLPPPLYTYNLFNQGNKVVFMNIGNAAYVSILKYDSKTGTGGNQFDITLGFSGIYSMFMLPTKNGKYLNFGNYTTSGGFDNAIDYFDDYSVLSGITSNTSNSRNRISSACIIGNNIYTAAIRFVDQNCYPTLPYGYRGILWIKKFNTDFLNQNYGVTNISRNENKILMYPNPSSGNFNIQSSSPIISYEILDMNGKIILQKLIDDHNYNTEIKLSLSNGIYFIKLISDEGVNLQKIIVSK